MKLLGPNVAVSHSYKRIKKKDKLIHVLAEVFLPPPRPDQKYVNHKDFNRSNNVLENLEWCTAAENNKHAYTRERKACAENMSKKVQARKVEDTEWTTYNSVQEASRALGINSGGISKMCCEAQQTEAAQKA